jgi:hypothetical protein
MNKDRDFYYDERWNEIHEGDLLRVWHFRGRRKRIYYMYHIAIKQNISKTGTTFQDNYWWAGKDYNRNDGKGHYWLKAMANPETGVIKGCRVIARAKWDESFRL